MYSKQVVTEVTQTDGSTQHSIIQNGSEDVSWYVIQEKRLNVKLFEKGFDLAKSMGLFPAWFDLLPRESQLNLYCLTYYITIDNYRVFKEPPPKSYIIESRKYQLEIVEQEPIH